MKFSSLMGLAFAAAVVWVAGCGDDVATDVCGNGVVEGFEQCDDGNSDNADGCSNDCLEWTPPAGDPIPAAADFQWQWVDVDGAMCRDGSPAGFGVSLNSASKNVMIYLEGGGACFDTLSCLANPASFDSSSFTGRSGGIFDRTNPDNPVADWNLIYVPYCTGDVHAGSKRDVMVNGELQQYVGYDNMGLFLDRIVPTFPDAETVLLTGVSAGGFGSAANAQQVQRDFGDVPVILLDDSGPPMSSDYLASCLQAEWRETWGLENTLLADCQWDCPDPNDFVLNLAGHLFSKYPDHVGGLVSHLSDGVISFFYGFGSQDCMSVLPTPLDANTFQAGLADFRSYVQDRTDRFGTYYIEGNTHTCIGGGCFYDTTVDGVPLTTWVADMIDGTTSHVAP